MANRSIRPLEEEFRLASLRDSLNQAFQHGIVKLAPYNRKIIRLTNSPYQTIGDTRSLSLAGFRLAAAEQKARQGRLDAFYRRTIETIMATDSWYDAASIYADNHTREPCLQYTFMRYCKWPEAAGGVEQLVVRFVIPYNLITGDAKARHEAEFLFKEGVNSAEFQTMNCYRELHLIDRFKDTSDEKLLVEAEYEFWHTPPPRRAEDCPAYQEVIRRNLVDRFNPITVGKEGGRA